MRRQKQDLDLLRAQQTNIKHKGSAAGITKAKATQNKLHNKIQ